jgi:hypothetical protein
MVYLKKQKEKKVMEKSKKNNGFKLEWEEMKEK